VRNFSGVGRRVGANNLSGVDFYCLNFELALTSNTLVYKVIYRTDVTICIYEKQVTILTTFFQKAVNDKDLKNEK
jgi:hypothetical protein